MKNRKIKFVSLIVIGLLALSTDVFAQYATALTVTDWRDATIAKKIEENGSRLLSEFNKAFLDGKTPSLNFGGISKTDKESMLTIWEITPFRCIETELIERLYNSSTGYQVRNIPVYLKGVPEEEAERDIVINFDKSGNIYDIFFGLIGEDINSINQAVTDLRKRQVILDFVENYRTAHNRRDINFISQVFSNDALIITGRVLKAQSTDMFASLSGDQIDYQVKTKDEYIRNLNRIFKNNKHIDIKFDEIKVTEHPKFQNRIYGVTLKQYWNTSRYSDVGYVFLSIDFGKNDDAKPLIKVRTWQPAEYQGMELDPEDIFTLGDFPVE